MRHIRMALVTLGTGLAVVLVACGNGPPPDQYQSLGIGGGGSSSGGGGGGDVQPVNGQTAATTVKASDALKFDPTSASVKVGQVVEFDNSGTALHNVTFDQGTKQDLPAGGTDQFKFSKAGTYKYQCTLHPGMTGEITVG